MKLNSIIPWKKEDRQLARAQSGNDPFALLQHRVNSLFDDLFSSQLPAPFRGNGFAPQIDLSETDKDVRITAELPGLDEKDIEVTLAENVLTLKGEKKEEHEEEKEDYYHSERSYGYFERSVQLPEGVDTDKAEAKFKKGVLKIAIPKKPGTPSSRRKIELQPG